jgi:hypothetical protein
MIIVRWEALVININAMNYKKIEQLLFSTRCIQHYLIQTNIGLTLALLPGSYINYINVYTRLNTGDLDLNFPKILN